MNAGFMSWCGVGWGVCIQVNRILGLAVGFFSVYTFSTLRDVNSPLYPFLTQTLQKVDPETAHDIVMWAAAHNLLPEDLDKDDPAARVALAGRWVGGVIDTWTHAQVDGWPREKDVM